MTEHKNLRTPDTPKLWCDMTPEEKGALLLAHHEGNVIERNYKSRITGDWLGWEPCDNGDLWDGMHDGLGFAYRVRPELNRKTHAIRLTSDITGKLIAYGTIDLIDGEPDLDSIKMERIND